MIAVVDSQKESLHTTSKILKEHFDFKIICFTNVEDFERSTEKYDIVLLNTDLSNIDGIKYSRNHLDKNIVFLTSQRVKMQDAFGPNIYGFINKEDSSDKYKAIIEDALERVNKYKRIILKVGDGLQSFDLDEIIYIQYIAYKEIGIVYQQKSYNVSGYSLKEINDMLGYSFIYIDRGTIINIHKVISIINNQLLLGGILQTFDISSRRLKKVKEELIKRQ